MLTHHFPFSQHVYRYKVKTNENMKNRKRKGKENTNKPKPAKAKADEKRVVPPTNKRRPIKKWVPKTP